MFQNSIKNTQWSIYFSPFLFFVKMRGDHSGIHTLEEQNVRGTFGDEDERLIITVTLNLWNFLYIVTVLIDIKYRLVVIWHNLSS